MRRVKGSVSVFVFGSVEDLVGVLDEAVGTGAKAGGFTSCDGDRFDASFASVALFDRRVDQQRDIVAAQRLSRGQVAALEGSGNALERLHPLFDFADGLVEIRGAGLEQGERGLFGRLGLAQLALEAS